MRRTDCIERGMRGTGPARQYDRADLRVAQSDTAHASNIDLGPHFTIVGRNVRHRLHASRQPPEHILANARRAIDPACSAWRPADQHEVITEIIQAGFGAHQRRRRLARAAASDDEDRCATLATTAPCTGVQAVGNISACMDGRNGRENSHDAISLVRRIPHQGVTPAAIDHRQIAAALRRPVVVVILGDLVEPLVPVLGRRTERLECGAVALNNGDCPVDRVGGSMRRCSIIRGRSSARRVPAIRMRTDQSAKR